LGIEVRNVSGQRVVAGLIRDEPVGEIVKVVKKIKLKELVDVKVVDLYHMSEEQKSVTIRTRFFDPEKTLSSDFIKMAEDQVVKSLLNANFPLKTV